MGEKILLIDDSQFLHYVASRHLKAEGYTVFTALDGIAGQEQAERLRPDLILLDIEMPVADGFEICRRLKSNVATTGIPIIFLTKLDSVTEKVRGLDLGACDYVTKPFDAAELMARVRAGLRVKCLMDLLARKGGIDGLTGLWNRRHFDQSLAAMGRDGRPTCTACILSDLDHLNEINERYGRACGDEVLRAVGLVFQVECGEALAPARYGPDEFVVLLPGATSLEAKLLSEHLRWNIAGLSIPFHDFEIKLTCSMGVAETMDLEMDLLMEAAAEALRQAKQEGCNRSVLADPPAGGAAGSSRQRSSLSA